MVNWEIQFEIFMSNIWEHPKGNIGLLVKRGDKKQSTYKGM